MGLIFDCLFNLTPVFSFKYSQSSLPNPYHPSNVWPNLFIVALRFPSNFTYSVTLFERKWRESVTLLIDQLIGRCQRVAQGPSRSLAIKCKQFKALLLTNYSAPVPARATGAVLRSCACKSDRGCTPVLCLQERQGLYSGPVPARATGAVLRSKCATLPTSQSFEKMFISNHLCHIVSF